MNSQTSVVIFDLDGTLTRPHLDFDAIRDEIGIVHGPILEAIERMDDSSRRRAEEILFRHEWDAARNAILYDGAIDVLREFGVHGFRTALMTRNCRPIVDYLVRTHGLRFDAVRTREDGAIKPSPEPVLSICRELCSDPRKSWVVGDYLFDILSGEAAGTRTALMIGDGPKPEYAGRASHVIRSLGELLSLVGVRP